MINDPSDNYDEMYKFEQNYFFIIVKEWIKNKIEIDETGEKSILITDLYLKFKKDNKIEGLVQPFFIRKFHKSDSWTSTSEFVFGCIFRDSLFSMGIKYKSIYDASDEKTDGLFFIKLKEDVDMPITTVYNLEKKLEIELDKEFKNDKEIKKLKGEIKWEIIKQENLDLIKTWMNKNFEFNVKNEDYIMEADTTKQFIKEYPKHRWLDSYFFVTYFRQLMQDLGVKRTTEKIKECNNGRRIIYRGVKFSHPFDLTKEETIELKAKFLTDPRLEIEDEIVKDKPIENVIEIVTEELDIIKSITDNVDRELLKIKQIIKDKDDEINLLKFQVKNAIDREKATIARIPSLVQGRVDLIMRR